MRVTKCKDSSWCVYDGRVYLIGGDKPKGCWVVLLIVDGKCLRSKLVNIDDPLIECLHWAN